MNTEEYSNQLNKSQNSSKKMKNLLDRISGELIDNGYKLSAGISASRMLGFFASVPYGRLVKFYPENMVAPIINGLKFLEGNLRCDKLTDKKKESFEETSGDLMDILTGLHWAETNLACLLDLYDQENTIRNSEIKPLFPSTQDFVSDTIKHLYNKMQQNENSTEINNTLKRLIILLPMGLDESGFLSYIDGTLRDATLDMPVSIINRIHEVITKLVCHTNNVYYTVLFNIAAKYGLGKKPAGLTEDILRKNRRRIHSFISRLDALKDITTSILLMYEIITDNSTKSIAVRESYFYLSDIISSYLAGEKIKDSSEDLINKDMLNEQVKTVSFLLNKTDTFATAGIKQSFISQTAYKGMMFARYDSMFDRMHSELFNLFEYFNYDELEEPSDDAYIDQFVSSITKSAEDELKIYPAFFRRVIMRNIMNELPIGFNDIGEVRKYICQSIASIADEKYLYYTEALVSALFDTEQKSK